MPDKNVSPAGSTPSNPVEPVETETPAESTPSEKEVTTPVESEKGSPLNTEKLEKMIADSQQMIGSQASEIGALREELKSKGEQQPEDSKGTDDLQAILTKMDDGDLSLADGFSQALELQGNKTTADVIAKITKMQEENAANDLQKQFHAANPDYQQLLDSGKLQPFIDNDPFGDPLLAYKEFKADEKINNLKLEYDEKIKTAKAEGAKLAQGAADAGTVIGDQGSAARTAAQTPKVFKTQQEAVDAMTTQLRTMRSAAR